MKHISLGGLDVSRIGLGTMAMSGYYLDPDSSDAESIRTIQRALELGVTHVDTAEIYGPYANEELVGRALRGRRDDVVVATKFGLVSHYGGGSGVPDSSPANIRAAVEGSLKRLGTDRIDLYYQHRVDPNTPIEDTVGALAELVADGKVLHIACPRPAPRPSAAPTPCIRSPRCRPSTPCGAVTRRPSCCRCCASWTSASCPTRRLGTASSPGRSAPPRS
jgi:aryl-alcohol dehydrogenase-like predicted oxidoreductase